MMRDACSRPMLRQCCINGWEMIRCSDANQIFKWKMSVRIVTVMLLNLADVIKSIPCLRETFETAHEIPCKLVKKYTQRDTKLDEIRNSTKNESKGVHVLCPTRQFGMMPWRPLLKIITLSNIKDTEMKAIMPTSCCSEPKLPRKMKRMSIHSTIMQHQKTDTAKFTLKPLTL